MPMPAARNLDPVSGVDIHMFLPPGSPSPVMAPSPFSGMLFDPADFASNSETTVFIQGVPRAIAGSIGIALVPHPPVPGPYVPPIPTHDCELQMGSSKVTLDGDDAGYTGLPVLSCSSTGQPPPPRKWKKTPLVGLYSPTSVVMATVVNVTFDGAPSLTA